MLRRFAIGQEVNILGKKKIRWGGGGAITDPTPLTVEGLTAYFKHA